MAIDTDTCGTVTLKTIVAKTLFMQDITDINKGVSLECPVLSGSGYTLKFPVADGTAGKVLEWSAGSQLIWGTGGGGGGGVTNVSSPDGTINVTNPTTTVELSALNTIKMEQLSNVNDTVGTLNQVLSYSGTSWDPVSISGDLTWNMGATEVNTLNNQKIDVNSDDGRIWITNSDTTPGTIGQVKIGSSASNNGVESISIGNVCPVSQGTFAIAMGVNGTGGHQALGGIAIGYAAAQNGQSSIDIAIGYEAGKNVASTGSHNIAIGRNAGSNGQLGSAIAIGRNSGLTLQENYSVAVGDTSGQNSLPEYSIALGYRSAFSGASATGFYTGFRDGGAIPIIAIDNANTNFPLRFNSTTGEIVRTTTNSIYAFNDLTDVTLTAPASGQVIAYNNVTSTWENNTDLNLSGGSMVMKLGTTDTTTQLLVQDSALNNLFRVRGNGEVHVNSVIQVGPFSTRITSSGIGTSINQDLIKFDDSAVGKVSIETPFLNINNGGNFGLVAKNPANTYNGLYYDHASGTMMAFQDLSSPPTNATNYSLATPMTLTSNLAAPGDCTIGGSLIISNDLTVHGTTTTINSTTVSIEDPLFELANNNTANAVDIGVYGKYVEGGITKYTGHFWDADVGKYKLFKGVQTQPTSTVDTTATGYSTATLVTNFEGLGDCSVTGSLTIDNIKIDGSTIGFTTDTDLITLADNSVTVAGNVIATGTVTGSNLPASGNLLLANDKYLKCGDSTQMKIGFDNTNSILTSTTGNLIVDNTSTSGSTVIRLGTDTSATKFEVQNNSEVVLFKVDGSGATFANISLDLGDNDKLNLGDSDDLQLYHDATNSNIINSTGHLFLNNTATNKSVIVKLGTDTTTTEFKVQDSNAAELFRIDGTGYTSIYNSVKLMNSGDSFRTYNNDMLMYTDNNYNMFDMKTNDLLLRQLTADKSIRIILGSDTSSSNFSIRNISNADKFAINGAGDATVTGSLTVDNIKIDGTTIGHTGDTDLLTLTSGQLVVAGNLDATNGLDVTGAVLTTVVGITNSAGEVLVSGGNVQLNDSIVLSLGTSDDVTMLHDGTNSKFTSTTGNFTIDNIATDKKTIIMLGTDTSTTAFEVQNDSASALFSVSGAGTSTITGLLAVDNLILDGTTIGHSSDVNLLTLTSAQLVVAGNCDITGGLDVTGAVLTTAVGITNSAGEVLVSGGNVQLNDSIVLSLGTSDDFTMLHNATNTLVTSNTGDLIIDNVNATGETIIQLGSDDTNTRFAIKNNTGAVLWECKGNGVYTSTQGEDHTVDDSNNTSMINVISLTHTTSGIPGIGIGSSIGFSAETFNGNNEQGMKFGTVCTDIGAGTEDFDMVVNLMSGGTTAAEKMRLTSDGDFKLLQDKSIILGTGSDITLTHDGTNSKLTSTTGNFTIDNTTVDKKTIVMLGTDTSATAFEVQNNSAAAKFAIDGAGDATVTGSVTVDNIKIDGTTIGHTGDTDLLTLTSGQLVVAGNCDVTNGLDVTGAVLTTAVGITNTAGEVLVQGGNIHLNDDIPAIFGTSANATIRHDNVNFKIANFEGNMTLDNTRVDKKTIMMLGTDTSATAFEVQNNSAATKFAIDGAGDATVTGSLAVDNIKIDGTTIGHTADTDLLTLTNGQIVIAGNCDVTGGIDIIADSVNLTIGASADITLGHDGTNSKLTSTTGNFTLDNTTTNKKTIMMLGTDTSATAFEVQNNSATTLFSVNGAGTTTYTGSLTIDDIIINGNTIGHTSDTDLLTLTSGQLVVAGNCDVTSGLDVTGAVLTTAVGITNTAGEVLVSGGNLQLNDGILLTLGTDDDLVIKHTGNAASITNTTGSTTIENTTTTSHIFVKFPTDTSTNSFRVRNNSNVDVFSVQGDGFAAFEGPILLDSIKVSGTTIGVFSVDEDLIGLSTNNVIVRGNLDVTSGINVTGAILATSAGMVNIGGEVKIQGGNLQLNDDIVLSLGTGDDVTMSHDATNSKITSATGNFTIDNTVVDKKTIMMLGTDTSATAFEVQNNSAAAKFTVDGSGQVDIGGNLDVTGGIDIDADSVALTVGAGGDISISHDGTNSKLTSTTGDFTLDNTNTSGATQMQLGTDSNATAFKILNNSGAALWSVDGSGLTTVAGDLTVTGTTTTVNSTTVSIADPLFELANNNSANSVDIGTYGKYVSSGTKYTGMFWDADVNKYRLFHGLSVQPTTTVNIAGGGYTVSTIVANLEGAGASSITGSLTVDNIKIDGTTIGHTADTDLLTLTSGQLVIAGNCDVTNGLDVTGAVLTTAVGITNTGGEVLVSGGNLQLNDSIVLSLGTGDDVSMSHDGTDSKITTVTGDFTIDNTAATKSTIMMLGTDTTATSFQVQNNSATALLKIDGSGVANFNSGQLNIESSDNRVGFGTTDVLSNVGDSQVGILNSSDQTGLWVKSTDNNPVTIIESTHAGSANAVLEVRAANQSEATDKLLLIGGAAAALTVWGNGKTEITGDLDLSGNLSIDDDNKLLKIGASSDITLVHDGTNSKLTSATGNFTIDNTTTNKKTIVMLGTDTSATAFEVQNNSASALFSVSGAGTSTVTGVLAVDNLVLDGTTIGHSTDVDLLTLTSAQLVVAGNLDVTNGVDVTGAALTTAVGITNTAGEILVSGGNVQLSDAVVLSFGDGDDLKIQHGGTNSKITSASGNFTLDNTATAATIMMLGTDTSAASFKVNNNSNVTKFKVDGAGQVDIADNLDVTGGIDIDADNVSLTIGAGADISISHDGTNSKLTSATGNFTIDNTTTNKKTIVMLGTDTAATGFEVQNNSASAVLAVNGLGDVVSQGQVYHKKTLSSNTYLTDATGGNITWSTAQMLGGAFIRTGSGARTDATATAAALVAAIPSCYVGCSFVLAVSKDTGNLTLNGGTGVTMVGHVKTSGSQLTLNGGNNYLLLFTITNVGSGTETAICMPIANVS